MKQTFCCRRIRDKNKHLKNLPTKDHQLTKVLQ